MDVGKCLGNQTECRGVAHPIREGGEGAAILLAADVMLSQQQEIGTASCEPVGHERLNVFSTTLFSKLVNNKVETVDRPCTFHLLMRNDFSFND